MCLHVIHNDARNNPHLAQRTRESENARAQSICLFAPPFRSTCFVAVKVQQPVGVYAGSPTWRFKLRLVVANAKLHAKRTSKVEGAETSRHGAAEDAKAASAATSRLRRPQAQLAEEQYIHAAAIDAIRKQTTVAGAAGAATTVM